MENGYKLHNNIQNKLCDIFTIRHAHSALTILLVYKHELGLTHKHTAYALKASRFVFSVYLIEMFTMPHVLHLSNLNK